MSYRAKTFYLGGTAKDYDKERFFSLKGRVYDWLEKNSITKALWHIDPEAWVLDIPCGTGRIGEHMEKLGFYVVGMDISKDMIEIASKKILITKVGDIEKLSQYDNTYDAVTCVRFMGHVPYEVKSDVLTEMKRVAKTLIVTFYLPKKKIDNWFPISEPDIKCLLNRCGLEVIDKFYVCKGWSDGVTYVLR